MELSKPHLHSVRPLPLLLFNRSHKIYKVFSYEKLSQKKRLRTAPQRPAWKELGHMVSLDLEVMDTGQLCAVLLSADT